MGGLDAALQRFTQGGQLLAQATACQVSQGLGIADTRKHGLDHGPPAGAQHIGGHRGQFDVGGLQHGSRTRVMAWARCWTKVLRARTRSRRSRMALGGMKLAVSSPWRSKSAIHSLSLTSVLWPGTAFMC